MRGVRLLAIAGLVLACGTRSDGTRSAGNEPIGSKQPDGTVVPPGGPASPSGGTVLPVDPAASCAGVAPPDGVPTRQYAALPNLDSGGCGAGTTDRGGTVVLPLHFSHLDVLRFFDGSDAPIAGPYGPMAGALLTQPVGAASVGYDYLGPYAGTGVRLQVWDDAGNLVGGTFVRVGFEANGVGLGFAADPSGGVLLAGAISLDDVAPVEPSAVMLSGSGHGARWGPSRLAANGSVRGVGVDVLGRSLVVTEASARFGAGAVSGQWFDAAGAALTGEFLIAEGVTFEWSTRIEASPLVGGGLFVREIDRKRETGPLLTRARPLAVVRSGEAAVSAPPAWLASRPLTRLEIVRGGRGYAVLPLGAQSVRCTQRVEVFAPDGTACGAREYPLAEGRCDTEDLALGADGTIIQRLPLSMEPHADVFGTSGCTWRWWPGALR